ncbi:hypothetical protein Tco_1003427 [Tanacetum coccineum]|uniref:Uncharacterized protein n=1 Tax=Tanacetum coccineum TaxID=301880 RepID=A0ABQ5F9N0_9ASTR
MEYFDLWDSCMIKSLKFPKSGNQLRFLIQRVPSRRTSNALSIPRRFSTLMFSSLIASVWASRIYDGSGYQQKGRKPSQNDKTEHGMEKTVQNQGQSPKMPKKSKSIQKNPT